MKLKNLYITVFAFSTLAVLLITVNGCKKAIDVGPSIVNANSSNAFTSNSSAQSTVAGIYSYLSAGSFFQGSNSVSLGMGLAADELKTTSSGSQSLGLLYSNSYSAVSPPSFWSEFYKEIFFCNTTIKGISESGQITPSVKNQLVSELKFFRGFIYFYAVNLYGTPPLTTTDDYQNNNTLSNSTAATVYAQILQDLNDAKAGLPDNIYVDASGAAVTDRVRPNKQVAAAMLARVYLYLQNWRSAENEASELIGNSRYTLVKDLNQVFLKGSTEIIFALQPVSKTYLNTIDANFLVVSASYALTTQLALNNQLVSAFEQKDQRRSKWIGTFTTTTNPVTTFSFANKYKVSSLSSTVAVTEYPIAMRLAEQYLIRAEARAQQSNLSGAKDDLNAIRDRAGLDPTLASGQTELLNAILQERRLELFTEWGHRWLDLKRSNNLDNVMSIAVPLKGGSWMPYKAILPIPPSDILANPNLKQNPGYN
ncbi:Starch-binding associating with outer membrane [Pedobacter steynii]|uniref:Starch-binding associating with outer membrane n=1 Tax=Pedobacter steynii TaxID=430522 RepID=A0A1G9PC83_9SPHI|nr:RagB/SusD family nutrient uptake outer membrane protein [Pedobacter steynii]NQX39027.1 RagB/SusD family nutrient uptake outer membrane protein [Pedobacter steynii]SDL96369.1 Starch-binding associating with outer membrane [Pedobacter steynii]